MAVGIELCRGGVAHECHLGGSGVANWLLYVHGDTVQMLERSSL